MATIRFYGDLKQFGTKFKINADTAAEALNGLYLQIKGLRQNIMNGYFRVRINKQDITEQTLKLGLHSKLTDNTVIHIVPKVAGAKRGGIFGFIAGAAMVIAGLFVISPEISAALIASGVGMMLSGVAQMLTKLPTLQNPEEKSNKNTSFSSLDNTIAQGSAVPLCYGTMKIGSKVLSQGLEALNG